MLGVVIRALSGALLKGAGVRRLCRYMARGPIAQERLSVDGDGLVVLELKRAFSDGTTHVL